MSNPRTPLVLQILALIKAEHGAPLPGASEQNLRAGVCKLAACVGEVYALRDLVHEDEAVWDRMRDPVAKLNPTQKARS